MATFLSRSWSDYELLDFGSGRKLERFGNVILDRPEVNARAKESMPHSQWRDLAQARFHEKGGQKGSWKGKTGIKDWHIGWSHGDKNIRFELVLTRFKHVGIFPEQSANWHLLTDFLSGDQAPMKVLNLFAYTGGASLVAKACGADVIHVDSVKQVLSWARRNMELSGLTDIRWVLEDAFKFAARELKRGNKYDAIIMDPPAYGLGAKGERWRLEDSIRDLIDTALKLLNSKRHLMILNTYSPKLNVLELKDVYKDVAGNERGMECDDLRMKASTGKDLRYGAVLRKVKY